MNKVVKFIFMLASVILVVPLSLAGGFFLSVLILPLFPVAILVLSIWLLYSKRKAMAFNRYSLTFDENVIYFTEVYDKVIPLPHFEGSEKVGSDDLSVTA